MNTNKICHCTLPYTDPSACSKCGTTKQVVYDTYYCKHGVNLGIGSFSCPECNKDKDNNYKQFFSDLFEQVSSRDTSKEHY